MQVYCLEFVQIIMNVQVFSRCLQELLKGEEFSRITFLRLLAQICNIEEHKQLYLAFYAYYELVYIHNTKNCLLAIEKGLSIQEESLSAGLLLAIKAALLTTISKHTEALQCFKEGIQIMHVVNQKRLTTHPLYKQIFPSFATKVLEALNFSRGRRQFLVLLDEIKGQIQGNPNFGILTNTVNLRMNQIRQSMKCVGKMDHQKKLLMSSSSMGMLGSIKHEREQESSTSIYINRLYEERRKNLGQRDKSSSNFKKTGISNPYQLNLHDVKEGSECHLM